MAAGGWDVKKQLDFAETLASKGLKKEALAAFEDYLKLARISAMESAKLLYRMGNMYMELFDYEKALYYFYKAEAADPSAGFKSELDTKLVECLENVGMGTQAKYELVERSAVSEEPENQAAGGAVLAKVAEREITEREIDDAINSMPDWAKESFSQGEGRVEFVRQYATTQALYNKAKMLGLDQDSDVRRSIRDVTKQILVQKYLERELKGKLSLDPADIQNFYEANKDKYSQETTAKAGVIKFSKLQSAQDAMRRLGVGADFAKMASQLSEDADTKDTGGLIEGDIEANGYIPGIGTSKEATDAIFSKKEGQLAGPFKINDSYYVFRISSIKPARQKSFNEVKDQIEYEYKNKKVQQEMQAILKDIMQQEQVEVYSDRILGKDEEQNKPNQPK
jgi:peptidyl-prolyl cis-trans isomerase C